MSDRGATKAVAGTAVAKLVAVRVATVVIQPAATKSTPSRGFGTVCSSLASA